MKRRIHEIKSSALTTVDEKLIQALFFLSALKANEQVIEKQCIQLRCLATVVHILHCTTVLFPHPVRKVLQNTSASQKSFAQLNGLFYHILWPLGLRQGGITREKKHYWHLENNIVYGGWFPTTVATICLGELSVRLTRSCVRIEWRIALSAWQWTTSNNLRMFPFTK